MRLSAAELQYHLDEIAAQWFLFCQQVGVPKEKLDQYEVQISGKDKCARCLNEGLAWWLANVNYPTYETIIQALRSPVIHNNRLANKIVKLRDAGGHGTQQGITY